MMVLTAVQRTMKLVFYFLLVAAAVALLFVQRAVQKETPTLVSGKPQVDAPATAEPVELRSTAEQRSSGAPVVPIAPVATVAPPVNREQVGGFNGEAVWYVVKQGDWLYRVARDYYGDEDAGMAVRAIRAANRLDSDVIYPGQVLLLPAVEDVPVLAEKAVGSESVEDVRVGSVTEDATEEVGATIQFEERLERVEAVTLPVDNSGEMDEVYSLIEWVQSLKARPTTEPPPHGVYCKKCSN